MSTVLAETTGSRIEDDQIITDVRVRGFSQNDAQRRIRATSRIKGLTNISIENMELEEETGTGSQNTYTAEIVSDR